MKNFRYFIILAILASVLFSFSIANAADDSGKGVSFRSAPVKEGSLLLRGYLYKPEGQGIFPAIIVLHGCAGVDWHHKNWAKQLTEWGYVALVVDSFSVRNFTNICEHVYQVSPLERASDAFGAVLYLKKQSYVDHSHIGILGFSIGAVAGLSLVQKNVKYIFDLDYYPFKAVVLFYPWCDSATDQDIVIPTLIHIGSKDDWTPSYRCIDLQKWVSNREMLNVNVYDGVYHCFDRKNIDRKYLGHNLRYNEKATKAAKEKTKEFLEKHLIEK